MSDHVWAAELATEMIGGNGRPMLLRTFTQSGDPWSPSLTPVDTPIIGLQTGWTRSDRDQFLIEIGDIKILIDSSVEPSTAGRIVDNGIDYSIIDFVTVAPGEQAILYKVQARR